MNRSIVILGVGVAVIASMFGVSAFVHRARVPGDPCAYGLVRPSQEALFAALKAPSTAKLIGAATVRYREPSIEFVYDEDAEGTSYVRETEQRPDRAYLLSHFKNKAGELAETCVVSGYVDAQNSFGAMLRGEYKVLWGPADFPEPYARLLCGGALTRANITTAWSAGIVRGPWRLCYVQQVER